MSIDSSFTTALTQAFDPTGSRVDSYVYSGHDACVRILNPAHDRLGRAVGWRDAAPAEFAPRSNMQWADLGLDQDGPIMGPMMGSPDSTMVARLLQCLDDPSTKEVVAAQWVGYADAKSPSDTKEVTLPPGRVSKLWTVSRDDLIHLHRIPMRWVHPELEWAVGNDIYGRSLFVSGSARAIETILASNVLESFRVSFSDPVSSEDW